MKTTTSFKQKLFIRLCNSQGFSLLELTIATLLASVFIVLCVGLFADQRQQFLTEQARTETNQNLRLSMDLIGIDIRQAGERLESDRELGKLSVRDGGGTSPDTLITQRKLINETLPVCQTITAGTATTAIDVSVTTAPVANCGFSDGNSDGITDNLSQFKSYRASQDGVDGAARTTTTTSCSISGGTDGECVFAYIHDPNTDRGEFFVYGFEDSGSCTGTSGQTCNRIYRADGRTWQNTYTYNPAGALGTQPTIYILEEREYSLVADSNTSRTDDFIMQLRLNRQNPVSLANKISNFQVTAMNRRGTATLTSFNFDSTTNQPKHVNFLRDAQYFKVELRLVAPDASVPVSNLNLTSQFFPRNALSW